MRGAFVAVIVLSLAVSLCWAQTSPEGGTQATSVEARPLASLDLFSAGAWTTGLPTGLWKGASADLAHRVLAGLGAQPMGPGLAQLARDTLQTAAAAPDGAGSDGDLAGERVLSLIRLGDLDAARAILARTPGLTEQPRLSQASADLALWTGDLDKACGVSEALSNGRDAPYWLQLRAFCLIRAGKPDQAQLALDFAAQASARTAQLQHLLAAAQGVTSGSKNPAQASNALGFAISRLEKTDIAAAIPSAAIPALIALSADEAQPAAVRRRAAARLLATGASAAEAVRSALRAPVAPPRAVSTPQTGRRKSLRPLMPVGEGAADALARDYQAAVGAATNTERAAALARMLRTASGASFRNLCEVTAPELALVTPDGLGGPDRALLALAASVVDAPSAPLLRDGLAPADGVGVVDLALLDAVREMAAVEKKAPGTAAALVKAGAENIGSDQARAQTSAVLLAAFDAQLSGLSSVERARFAAFRTGPAMKAAAALAALAAAEKGAAGEAVLMTLDAASEKGLTPSDRALFIRALSRAGLDRNARSIALDGLLAAAGH
jgi:hypothetical protein